MQYIDWSPIVTSVFGTIIISVLAYGISQMKVVKKLLLLKGMKIDSIIHALEEISPEFKEPFEEHLEQLMEESEFVNK